MSDHENTSTENDRNCQEFDLGSKPERSDDETKKNDEGKFIVRCRGLPWETTEEELMVFFVQCKLRNGIDSVHITKTREGRPSGEAYIELESEEDLETALTKDRKHIGKRYVEVFRSTYTEFEWVQKRLKDGSDKEEGDENVVRLRGLPFGAKKTDILSFFDGLDISTNGILLTSDGLGRASGEAYVKFANAEHAEKALEKNKQTMGHRYIEVFKSSMQEAQRNQMPSLMRGGKSGGGYGMMRRPGPYDRPSQGFGRGYGYNGPRGGMPPRGMKSFSDDRDDFFQEPSGFGFGGAPARRSGFIVRMRGLPFKISEKEISEWFSSVVDPVDVVIKYSNGRPSGDAEVLFASDDDARKAMTKHRQNLQHRYIELFYDAPESQGPMSRGGPIPLDSVKPFGFNSGFGGPGSGFGGPSPIGFQSSMSSSAFGYC